MSEQQIRENKGGWGGAQALVFVPPGAKPWQNQQQISGCEPWALGQRRWERQVALLGGKDRVAGP